MSKITLIAALALLVALPASAAQKMDYMDVPETVRQAILDRKPADSEGLTIKRDRENDRTVFHAQFHQRGINRRVTVAADGTIMADNRVHFNQLPKPVQESLAQLNPSENWGLMIRQDTENGRPVYKATFREPGPNRKLTLTPEGTILEDSKGEYTVGHYPQLPLFPQPEPLRFGDMPVVAQEAVRAEIENLENIEVKWAPRGEMNVYDISVPEGDRVVKLSVTAEGVILSDSRAAGVEREPAGAKKK